MIKNPFTGLACAALLASGALSAQEVWTDEQLEQEMAGFKENKTGAELKTLAHLLANEKAAAIAICNRIHGNHAEYLLRIEKLMDQLSDDRWQNREDAERTLIEIGGKARELITARAKSTERTAEERIRAARALDEIKRRGTAKEELEAQYIRGLALTAIYMGRSPKLTKALVSALQHTDPIIVTRCIRALGRHGDDEVATKLIALLDSNGSTYGGAVRAALATLPGTKGPLYIVDQLVNSKVDETSAMLLLRILRERPDGEPMLRRIAEQATSSVIIAAASLVMPEDLKAPVKVQVSLADQTRMEGELLGYAGDRMRLGKPTIVNGEADRDPIPVDELTFPLNRCDGVAVVGAAPVKSIQGCRMFLVQGTLVTGELLAVTADKVVLQSRTFGRMEVPRAQVQGLATDPKLDRLLGASSKEDKVRFKNNNLAAGRIVGLNGQQVTFVDEKGAEQVVSVDDIAGMLFQRPLQTSVDNRTFTRVVLANGDKVLGHVAAVTSSHVGIVAPGVGSTVVAMKDIVQMEFEMGGGAMWGFTLVADYSDNRIVEFDDQGREVFSIEEIFGVWDVECLDNGNLLITEFSVNRVSEVTRDKKTVWSFEDLKNPYDADRLPNGNTLIADTFGRRVIEVDKEGKIVWCYDKGIHPYDVDRLPNGNTLIADTNEDRVIEVDQNKNIVWQIKNVPNVHDADRLPNGNTLLTIRMLNEVREVDPSGKTVMTIKNLSSPSDADRLPNGDTIVAENGFVRVFDRHGNEVWRKPVTWAVEVNRY